MLIAQDLQRQSSFEGNHLANFEKSLRRKLLLEETERLEKAQIVYSARQSEDFLMRLGQSVCRGVTEERQRLRQHIAEHGLARIEQAHDEGILKMFAKDQGADKVCPTIDGLRPVSPALLRLLSGRSHISSNSDG